MPGLEDEFGDVVRKARAGLDISVEDLAARTGLSERDVKSIEVYTGHPDEAHVRRLAEALGLRQRLVTRTRLERAAALASVPA